VRGIGFVIGVYVGIALLTRAAEAGGLHRCGCRADCWCRRPVLNAFRWVFPFRHRAHDARWKEAAASRVAA
jgi:hypothetical protein